MERENFINIMESSNFEMSEDDILKLEKEIQNIIIKCDELEKVNTEGVEPLFSVLENKISNRFNDDTIINSSEEFRKDIFDENKMVDGFYQVPSKEGN